jgi:hypothetical protein
MTARPLVCRACRRLGLPATVTATGRRRRAGSSHAYPHTVQLRCERGHTWWSVARAAVGAWERGQGEA